MNKIIDYIDEYNFVEILKFDITGYIRDDSDKANELNNLMEKDRKFIFREES